jgi:DNA-binding response OmpR family regulator
MAECNNVKKRITSRYWALLHLLSDHEVHSRKEISEAFDMYYTSSRAIDVCVRRIREMFGSEIIECVWRKGYRMPDSVDVVIGEK